MVNSEKGFTQNNELKSLFFKTPLLESESITSWLVRASLRQGCAITTFTYYYWQKYNRRMWLCDVDKGFNQLDSQIHADMACLAETDRERFDKQTINYLITKTSHASLPKVNVSGKWILPLSKRHNKSLMGYAYCPLCLKDDKTAYLKLYWRLSWYVYCPEHTILLENKCFDCDMPYQPNLIDHRLKSINHCHACEKRLCDSYLLNRLLVPNAFKLQQKAIKVLESQDDIYMFDKKVSIADWFELMLYFINIARKASQSKDEQYLFFRLFKVLGISTQNMGVENPALEDSSTGLPFDYLPVNERMRFMNYAYMLMDKPLIEWIKACHEIKATQNTFEFVKSTQKIPTAFLPIYEQLDRVYRKTKKSNKETKSPTAMKSVQKSWERIQRKIQLRSAYEQNLTAT